MPSASKHVRTQTHLRQRKEPKTHVREKGQKRMSEKRAQNACQDQHELKVTTAPSHIGIIKNQTHYCMQWIQRNTAGGACNQHPSWNTPCRMKPGLTTLSVGTGRGQQKAICFLGASETDCCKSLPCRMTPGLTTLCFGTPHGQQKVPPLSACSWPQSGEKHLPRVQPDAAHCHFLCNGGLTRGCGCIGFVGFGICLLCSSGMCASGMPEMPG